MSSTTHTLCSGSYGLISTECGPRPSSNRWSHCVHDSIDLPFPSTTTMQLRNSGVGVVACSLNDPQKPVKPGGTVAGSLSSPRLAMKMRVGDSAKMPPVDSDRGGRGGLLVERSREAGEAGRHRRRQLELAAVGDEDAVRRLGKDAAGRS